MTKKQGLDFNEGCRWLGEGLKRALELMMHGRACHKKLQSRTKQFFKRIQDESEQSAFQKHVVYTDQTIIRIVQESQTIN